MTNAIATVESSRLQIVNNEPTTTSKDIAEVFDKRPADLIRSIESLQVPDAWRKRNFALSSYLSSQNKKFPQYRMTKDGFTFLVMGFTGKKASLFKIAYIEAFNKMQKSVESQPQLSASSPSTSLYLIYKGEKVLPTNFVSYLFKLSESGITSRKGLDKYTFIEGTHYFDLHKKEIDTLLPQLKNNPFLHISPSATKLTLWTKEGILQHYRMESNNHTKHVIRGFIESFYECSTAVAKKYYTGNAEDCAVKDSEILRNFCSDNGKDSIAFKLLRELKADGHNVMAATFELTMLRMLLNEALSVFKEA